MDWREARATTLEAWQAIRDSIATADDLDLLQDINAVCDLCEKAKEAAAGEEGRCTYCLAYQQFGGCQGINLRMSEAVVSHDRETLRALVDEFIANLEAMDAPSPAEEPAFGET